MLLRFLIVSFFLIGSSLQSIGAELNAIYEGLDTIYSNGALSKLIVDLPVKIDTNRSFLMFESASTGDRPANGKVRGKISSDSTVTFFRLDNASAPGVAICISWNVVEFEHGVKTQRGQISMAQRKNQININPVVSTSQAFLLFSKTAKDIDNSYGWNDYILADFNSVSQIEIRVRNSTPEHIINWEVVEFTNPADINVQRGKVLMNPTTTFVLGILPTPVDLTKTFLLTGHNTKANNTLLGAHCIRSELTNSTTLTFQRLATSPSDSITEINYQVVELLDGSIVHSGKTDFAIGEKVKTETFPQTVQAYSIAFASSQPSSGQNMGNTDWTTNDDQGVCIYLIDLTSDTQVQLERKLDMAVSSVNWFVLQFACSSPADPGPVLRK